MAKITQYDVDAAADRLQRAGTTPTNDAVHALLDHRGSRTTLVKYLRIWREQNLSPELPDIPDMPADLRAQLGQAWAGAIRMAHETATDGLAEFREHTRKACDEAVYGAKEEAAKAQQALEEAERENAVAHERLAHIESARSEAAAHAERLQGELDAALARFNEHQAESRTAIEQARAEADKARSLLESYKSQADSQHREIRTLLEESHARYEADTGKLLRQLDEERQATKKEHNAVSELREKLAESRESLHHAQHQITMLTANVEEQKKAVHEQREDREAIIEGWREALNDARDQAANARESEATAKAQVEKLIVERDEAQQHIKQLAKEKPSPHKGA